MKKLNLGQTFSMLANIGVVVGILLLVYELSQNRQVMRAQTRSVLSQGYTDNLFHLSTDDSTSDIYYRASTGGTLTDAERFRYRRLMLAQFGYLENVHYQYRNGLYDEAEFLAHRNRWKNGIFSTEAAVEVWCTARNSFSPEFVSEVGGLLDEPCD